MTDYTTMLQRVQAQIRQLELTAEQIEDQMQPLKTQERTLLGILRALEEQRAELTKKDDKVTPMPREKIAKIDDKTITPTDSGKKKDPDDDDATVEEKRGEVDEDTQ